MGPIMVSAEVQKQMANLPDGVRILSIGHSNHEPARFLQLLQQAGVTALADVRSQPYSQRHPHFNRPELQRWLQEHDIVYGFLGDLLGGRPQQPSLYDADGRVNYERVRRTKPFEQGLERLRQAAEEYVVAMFCAEEDPLACHRGLMIAPALLEGGTTSAHIRGDDAIESMEEMEARLLVETKVGVGIVDGLFAATLSSEEQKQMLVEAYRRQARRKAFRLQPGEAEE